jgi:hypothetical protein
MRRQIVRRVSKSAKAGQALAFFSVVLGVVATFAHRIGQIDTLSFLIAGAAAAGIALLALGFATLGIWRLWSEGAKAGGAVLRTFILAGVTLAPLLFAFILGLQTPLINDVSTDWTTPPQFPIGSRINVTPPFAPPKSQVEIAQLQLEAYPDIVTQKLLLEPQLAEQIVRAAAKTMGWEPTSRSGSLNSADGATQAFETRSLIFGFADDIIVRLKQSDDGLLMDVRSTGRAGEGDLGANAKRIRAFFAAFASEQRKRGI